MKTLLAPRASSILYDILVGRGDPRPFLLPANICPIVPMTFFKAGVPFELVDISAPALHIDLERVEGCLSGKADTYGGLLYAHPYGDAYTPDSALRGLKEQYPSLIVIDDRCLCVPDLLPDPDTFADVTLYSTGYAKIVDIGFGGFAFVRSDLEIEHRRLPFDSAALKNEEEAYKDCLKSEKTFIYHDSDWLQTDSELPLWQEYANRVAAALPDSLAHRKALNAVYNAMVPPELQLPDNYQLWRFNVRMKRKQPVLEAIFRAGLFASSHYASLVGIMGDGTDENARDLAAHIVNLFNDHHYTLDMAERTAEIVRRSV